MVKDVLDGKDEIVAKILEKTDLTADSLESKIKEKQEEFGGLLTDAGAAYSIAKDMNIDLGFQSEEREHLQIQDLKPGLDSVDLVGAVASVFPVRHWERDGRSGKVANLVLKDHTGEIRLALWNKDADMVETGKIQRGTIIEAQNAYIKERNGLLDLNLGSRGRVIIKETADVPEIKETLTKITDLEEGMNDVNCFARVVRGFPVHEFQRENGTGKVSSLIITDGTETRVSMWDANADFVEKVAAGDVVKLEGAYAKQNQDRLELNLGWRGRIVINPENAPQLPEVFSATRADVSNLSDEGIQEIRANVVAVFPPTVFEVCSKCGKKAESCEHDAPPKKMLILNAELDDGTGVVRGVFFREMAEKFLGFSAEEFAKNPSMFSDRKMLGDEYVFQGTAKRNDAFDRSEFVVKTFKGINVQKEIELIA